MSFLYPSVLTALLLPLLLAVAAVLAHRRAGSAWKRLVSAGHEHELVRRRAAWRTVLPAALALLALSCAILGAARPIYGYGEGSSTATGRNLLIALDISRSMETKDVTPSRLEEARAAAYELIDALPNDKIGLIVFSGEADLVVPLTYDHDALRDAIAQVDRSWAGYGGTNFGLVLRTAMRNFERSAPDGTNALVILSDGEDTVDTSLELAEEARKRQLLIITVGIGTPEGDSVPDPTSENGLFRDAEGKHVISRLDAQSLQRFSNATGGSFFLMRNGSDLAAFAKKAVSQLEAHEDTVSLHKVPNDLFMYFAAAALLLLTAAILLSTEWRRARSFRHTPLLALAALLWLGARAEAAPARDSIEAFQQGLDLQTEDPAKAREAFSRALQDEDPELQAAAHYQLGQLNTLATFDQLRQLYGQPADGQDSGGSLSAAPQPQGQQVTPEALKGIVGQLKKDIVPYQDALTAAPSLAVAQHNIDKVNNLINILEEEIKRLENQQNQDNQQNQQDQQNQDNQQNQQDQQNKDNQQDQQDQQNKDNQQNQQDQQNKDNQQNQQDQQNQDNQQNQQDQQNKDNQQNQQDQQNQDNQQNQQDQQNKDNQQDQQDQQNKNNQQDQQNQDNQQNQQDQQNQDNQQDQQDQQNKDNQQQNQKEQERQAQEQQMQKARQANEKDKQKQRAASILKMHLDEEKGSPIPHADAPSRPPRKDY